MPVWYLSIFIFFIGSIFFTQKVLLADNRETTLSKAFYAFGILMTLRFLLSVIQRVQSDALVLFLLSLFIFALFRKKDILAGIFLATACMVKLTPLIFLLYLGLKKRIKASAACAVAILFYTFVPALYVGPAKNIPYLKNWFLVHQTNPPDYLLWFKNQSLLSMLSRFLTQNSAVGIFDLSQAKVLAFFIIVVFILFGAIFISGQKLRPKDSGFAYLREFSLVLICMILFSPLAWKHTFVHLIIPHLVLIYYALYINPQDRITKALLIISFFLNTILNPELTGPFSKTIQLYSSITVGTLILYVALLRLNFKSINYKTINKCKF